MVKTGRIMLRRRLLPLAGAALLGLSGGCANSDSRSYEGLKVSETAAPRVGEAVLVSRACPIVNDGIAPVAAEPEIPSLAPALAVPLIGIAVDLAANAVTEALQQAEQGLSGSFLALGSVPQVGEDDSERLDEYVCVIVARGLIGPVGSSGEPVAVRDGALKREHLELLGLADYPAFYLEMAAKVEPVGPEPEGSQEEDAAAAEHLLTLSPLYLHYAQSSATRQGSGKKTLTVAIALARKQPAGKDKLEEGAAAVFRFNFGRLAVGHAYDEARLRHLVAAQVVDKEAAPSIAALVTESEDASIALKALTSAFASNKDSLTKALKDTIAETVNNGE